jgi:uncharacterized protein YdhG (YjbR/CyaY superfamily)
LPDDQRAALEDLRLSIKRAAPEAEEAISYGAPAFRYRGRPLVSFGAAKSHVAFYVMSPAVLDAHRDKLEGYDTSKGAIRFQPERPVPDAPRSSGSAWSRRTPSRSDGSAGEARFGVPWHRCASNH